MQDQYNIKWKKHRVAVIQSVGHKDEHMIDKIKNWIVEIRHLTEIAKKGLKLHILYENHHGNITIASKIRSCRVSPTKFTKETTDYPYRQNLGD